MLFVLLVTVVLFQSYNEDLDKDKALQNCLERDAAHIANSLGMAQEEVQRLTNKLQVKEEELRQLGKLCFQVTVSGHVLTSLIFSENGTLKKKVEHKYSKEKYFTMNT